MDLNGVDVDFLTDEEILELYNDVLDDDDFIASYCSGDRLCNYSTGRCSYWAGCKSDERLKDNISDNLSGLKEINSITVKNYIYKDDKNKTPHVGVIAQQLKEVFPNAVFEDEKGYLSIRTEDIFYSMVNAIKELYVLNQDLNTKLNEIKKSISKE